MHVDEVFLLNCNNVCWRNVSSPMLVVCFFRWFDEVSGVDFEAGVSLIEKVGQGRKWQQKVHIFVVLTAERERVCVCCLYESKWRE